MALSEKQRLWKPGRNEAAKLRAHGFDGLYSPGECACLVDDLYPCGKRQDDCTPGYKGDCDDTCEHEAAGEGNWHVSPEKPKVSR